jgi:hypothetical protein
MRRKVLKGNPIAHISITLATIAVGTVIFLACSLATGQTGNSTSSIDAEARSTR